MKYFNNDYIKDLCDEVNRFDKDFGIKLKHMNYDNEPVMVFKNFTETFQKYMYSIICEINGIGKDRYVNKKNKVLQIKGEEFTKLSLLEWDKKETYEINSYIFKCRFLTAFLLSYIDKIEKIVENKFCIGSVYRTGIYENSYFYCLKISKFIRRFISVFLSGNSYSNIILQINQDCNYSKIKNRNPDKVNKYIKDIKQELEVGLKYSILKNGRELPDDIAINSILQLTYLLCTCDDDLDELPHFKDVQGATVKDNLRGLIEALGEAITKRKYRKRPMLYVAFNRASPNILSRYKDINENIFLNIGVRSLEYTKFFCNNKDISKFIDLII